MPDVSHSAVEHLDGGLRHAVDAFVSPCFNSELACSYQISLHESFTHYSLLKDYVMCAAAAAAAAAPAR